MPQIVIFLLVVGAGWIIISWLRMLYGSRLRTLGFPLPIIGHSYKFMVPLEDLWTTAEKIIADYDPDEKMVKVLFFCLDFVIVISNYCLW